jgi:3-keto-5-aminohexanoate cleavage enzyme
MERDAVVVEVGCNEGVARDHHQRIPITPEEIADDARRCEAAGAAAFHWHARDPATGEQRAADPVLYGDALDLMRPGEIVAYPTYPTQPAESVDDRLGHCFVLRERHGLEVAPIDIGSVNVVTWDASRQQFAGALDTLAGRAVVQNSLGFTVDALARFDRVGLVPSVAAFDVGFTRTMVNLVRAGYLHEPVFFKIFLMGTWAAGPEPSPDALEFHVRQIPEDLDVEWIVVPYTVDDADVIERIARRALELGGGVRVGIGDNPAAHPGASNPELVERVARWATEAGRPVATGAELRARLALG